MSYCGCHAGEPSHSNDHHEDDDAERFHPAERPQSAPALLEDSTGASYACYSDTGLGIDILTEGNVVWIEVDNNEMAPEQPDQELAAGQEMPTMPTMTLLPGLIRDANGQWVRILVQEVLGEPSDDHLQHGPPSPALYRDQFLAAPPEYANSEYYEQEQLFPAYMTPSTVPAQGSEHIVRLPHGLASANLWLATPLTPPMSEDGSVYASSSRSSSESGSGVSSGGWSQDEFFVSEFGEGESENTVPSSSE